MAIAKFGLAVNRMKKDEVDFFNLVAFGKTGELIAERLQKGSPILITGHMQMGSYTDKGGVKKYTADVIVDRFDFIGKKNDNQEASTGKEDNYKDKDITPIDSGDIPFK